ncbi:hypothetical protein [Agrobacterium tumefaciens]|nr:hypothetical protein [Agrobacterium tumefaciens]NSY97953.1 hypothetical protein [Agrobacterium tumefaciens]
MMGMKDRRDRDDLKKFHPGVFFSAEQTVRLRKDVVVKKGNSRTLFTVSPDHVEVRVITPAAHVIDAFAARYVATIWGDEMSAKGKGQLTDKVSDRDQVINRLTLRMRSKEAAERWYRSYHISSYGGKTAAQLVRVGRIKSVLRFIDSLDAGVHV